MITYLAFTLKYPAFGLVPYTQGEIEAWLEEVGGLFPQIDSCLPENLRLLATYYALRYLEDQYYSESPAPILSISSRLDSITYSLAGKGNELVNNTYGLKLVRLFKTHGCYHSVAPASRCADTNCGGCGRH